MISNPDPLIINRGAITAPAGCGKTHLISDAVCRHSRTKPILVLTHTNAGVAALKGRLKKLGVRSNCYKLSTIAGWCMKVAGTYCRRSGLDPTSLQLNKPDRDYQNISNAIIQLLKNNHIDDIIRATYDRLIVDEYQDCTQAQHEIICLLSELLPTCVLGDPLQTVFNFKGDAPDWKTKVLAHFTDAGALSTPWRWDNAGKSNFGKWLLSCRNSFINKTPIDLRKAPSEVSWERLSGTHMDFNQKIATASKHSHAKSDSVLIIANSSIKITHQKYAMRIYGAVVVENTELSDFVTFAKNLDMHSSTAVNELIHFAGSVMTGVGAPNMIKRIYSLSTGTARKPPTDAERAAIQFKTTQTPKSAAEFLVAVHQQHGTHTYRNLLLGACVRALNACSDGGADFAENAVRVREQYRYLGRTLPRCAVGSPLLLKGLEANVSVVLDADTLSTNELYVAMTRGSHKLVVCAKSPPNNTSLNTNCRIYEGCSPEYYLETDFHYIN